MKTIFRSLNLAVLVAAFCVAGTTAGFAQDPAKDPCSDTAGQNAISDKIREIYAKVDLENLKTKVELGKQFNEKYGSCDSAKDFSEYLKTNLPKWEAAKAKAELTAKQKPLIEKFNAGLTSKNWDDVYLAGKELIAQWADDFRAAELVLGSIGLDETANKTPPVTKWNEDTLKYAKMSIADLESGKSFGKTYGVSPGFVYKSKDDALGWMNYTIGFILAVDKKDKKEAVSYLYKATQATSDTASNPVVYDTIGLYYFEEVDRLLDDVKAKIAAQDDKDTEDVKKQKVEAIKNAVAQANGAAERALDVYARAYKFAPKDEKSKTYREGLYKKLQNVYKVRFGKLDGLDAWIASASATPRPLPNPATPITPIFDPEPAAAPATTTSGSTTTATPAPATEKPDAKTPAKPATKPAAAVKPQAGMKSSTAKKKKA